jgi:hypothetical protein
MTKGLYPSEKILALRSLIEERTALLIPGRPI